jgi:beta-lactamase regulating signal transducer with metallopeptidase domain
MSAAETLQSMPYVQPIAWALVHSAWQGGLLALALAAALSLLRSASPRLRYGVALAAFLALPALVVATAWRAGGAEDALARAARWRGAEAGGAATGAVRPVFATLGAVREIHSQPAGASAPAASGAQGPETSPAQSLEAGGPRAAAAGGWGVAGTRSWRAAATGGRRAAAALGVVARMAARMAAGKVVRPALPWLFAAWLCGVAAFSAVQLAGWLEIHRRRRRGARLAEELRAVVPRLCRSLGIRRPVALLESAAVAVPAVIGWLRPVVLVPASALAGLTPQQLELILAHELAHVRRNDYLVNLVQAVVETLLFYHPAAWWMSRQVRREREHCCDDLAVAVAGNRLEYARALAVLEELRAAPLRLAPAATGPAHGVLLSRIRRLLAPAAGARAPRAASGWLAGALGLGLLAAGAAVPLFGIAALGASEAATVGVAVAPQSTEPRGAAEAAGPAESWHGEWTARRERGGDQVRLQLSHSDRHGNWSSSFSPPADQLVGFGGGPEARFELRRDAGTFAFTGRFESAGDGVEGAGFFTFRPNPAFVRDMAGLGYQVSQDRLLELAIHDVSLSFVREIQDLGYRDIALDRLVEFRIHRVTPAFVRELAALGYRSLPAERLTEFRIHGVTPDFVRALGAEGYRDIPAGRVVELRIHRVTPELVRELDAQGYRNLPVERLVEFRIHGVTPEYLRELAAAGYQALDPAKLVEFRIHRVTPEYLRELAAAGYSRVSPNELVEMRIHRVDAAFIREAASRGHRNLSPGELVELRIHGLDREGRRRDDRPDAPR